LSRFAVYTFNEINETTVASLVTEDVWAGK
jgi:hypothetical protein